MKTRGARPPLQTRSQATLDRFLQAAATLLAERRFEDASVQEIVQLAGSSVGAFYTRFQNKEALLHHLTENLFAQGHKFWESFLDPSRWNENSAAEIVEALIEVLIKKRKEHRGLLRALALYSRAYPESHFARNAAELNRHVSKLFRQLMMQHRREIEHPEPEEALDFILFSVDAVIREAILFGHFGLPATRLSNRAFKDRICLLMLSYLGIAHLQGEIE